MKIISWMVAWVWTLLEEIRRDSCGNRFYCWCFQSTTVCSGCNCRRLFIQDCWSHTPTYNTRISVFLLFCLLYFTFSISLLWLLPLVPQSWSLVFCRTAVKPNSAQEVSWGEEKVHNVSLILSSAKLISLNLTSHKDHVFMCYFWFDLMNSKNANLVGLNFSSAPSGLRSQLSCFLIFSQTLLFSPRDFVLQTKTKPRQSMCSCL